MEKIIKKIHKSTKYRPRKDPAPTFFTREGIWREPVPGEIIYLPGSTRKHRVDAEGNVWMAYGDKTEKGQRWILRFFSPAALKQFGQRALPGMGLTSYSLLEPQYTRRKRN